MKLLTLNFLTCAVKACKSSSASFPLHPKECELVSDTIAPNPKLIYNILPRIDWQALVTTASEVSLSAPLPSSLRCLLFCPTFTVIQRLMGVDK
jgi:multifunctional methyltransferase subunit TRM112